MSGLTLWAIEESILGLAEVIESPDATQEEKAIAQQELVAWTEREVTKVDRVRAFLRHCETMEQAAKLEKQRMDSLATVWANRAKRLKDICLSIMQHRDVKRLEGATGVIRRQANGGKLALVIDRADLVPPKYKTFTYTFTHSQLVWLCKHVNIPGEVHGPDARMDESAIRKALETNCAVCEGNGKVYSPNPGMDEAEMISCSQCDGTGHQLVPGARLEERGEHVRVE